MLERILSYVDNNSECHNVVAIIDTPKKQERPLDAAPSMPDTYTCDFRVSGADLNIKGTAFGIDEFHAVLGAFRDLRNALDALGNRIMFLGNAGYTGIPRMVRLNHPIEVQRRFEAVLDAEHQRHFDELQARGALARGEAKP